MPFAFWKHRIRRFFTIPPADVNRELFAPRNADFVLRMEQAWRIIIRCNLQKVVLKMPLGIIHTLRSPLSRFKIIWRFILRVWMLVLWTGERVKSQEGDFYGGWITQGNRRPF